MRKLLAPALFLIAALCMGAIGGALPVTSLTGLGTNVSTWLAANLTLSGAAKFNGSGVLSQAASTDLSDTTAATTWAPTDQSGLSLTFSSTAGSNFSKSNKTCVGQLNATYPSTANGTSAKVSLPCTMPNSGVNVLIGPCTAGASPLTNALLIGLPNTATALILNSSNAAVTNANLSLQTLGCAFSFVSQ